MHFDPSTFDFHNQEATVVEVTKTGHMTITKVGSEWQVVNRTLFNEMVGRHNMQVNEIDRLNAIIDELIDELRKFSEYEIYTPRMLFAEFVGQATDRKTKIAKFKSEHSKETK